MTAPTHEHSFSTHLSAACAYHARMLADGSRNLAIKAALEKHIDPSKTFMDVGSGTGIWAVYAAKLGARRVVAVEMEEALIPMIHKHAQENGVVDRVEIIHGNADDLVRKEEFDVILCELFGNDAYGERTTRSFIRLREIFLADGGVLLPEQMALYSVPLRCSRPRSEFPAGVPIAMSFFQSVNQNYSRLLNVEDRKNIAWAAEPKLLTTLDYRSIKEPLQIVPLIAEWEVEDLSSIDAILCFTITNYGDGIDLDSLGSGTWLLAQYDFVPFDVDSGTVRFSLTMDPQNPVWSISLTSDPSVSAQTHSPVFAFTRAKMALDTTPYIKLERSDVEDEG